MIAFEHALILILLTTCLSVAGRWIPWPQTITYVLGAIGAALLGFPRIELDPGFFFLCFVPPLLFSDGWLMPLREFAAAKRWILSLATGLVIFTTACVGLVAHWLVPTLPLAMAFALGAVVSPTDAIAVSAITEKLKVPTRLITILNGESLMNDATGLVAFKFALAALATGAFSLRAASMDFLIVALGGGCVGLVVAYLVGLMRDALRRVHGSDALIEVTVSLLIPYAAYFAAEPFGFSSILAVVAAGLYSGWRDPLRMDLETRQISRGVWTILLFWLNGLAFVLLGLQFPEIWAAVRGLYSPGRIALLIAAVSGVAIVSRIAWFFPGAYLPFILSKKVRDAERRPTWQTVFVGGWAGLRGTVTLAAALSIPLLMENGKPFPGRELVIFLAFGVIVVTLLVQGTTLEWMIRRLGLREDDTRAQEDRLARIAAVEAGLKSLRSYSDAADTAHEKAALGEVVAEYEHRLAELTAEGETRVGAHQRRTANRRHRMRALLAERASISELWRQNIIDDETHRPLQRLLDHEEAMLGQQSEQPER